MEFISVLSTLTVVLFLQRNILFEHKNKAQRCQQNLHITQLYELEVMSRMQEHTPATDQIQIPWLGDKVDSGIGLRSTLA